MAPFYGWVPLPQDQSHFEEAVYFLPKFPEISGTRSKNIKKKKYVVKICSENITPFSASALVYLIVCQYSVIFAT